MRVRVAAAALNRLDLFVLGGIPGVRSRRPGSWAPTARASSTPWARAVTAVRPGDRVVVNPGIGAAHCEYCRDGDEPLCPRFGILGEHVPGTLAEYVVVPEG